MGFGGAEGFHIDNTGGGGTIGGGGTLNYIAKFTPDGTHIGDSLLFDNGVSIGFGTAVPDASATFDIDSTTQGFLVPRMTAVQKNAIVGPATSLLVFDTSAGLFSYFDGAVWQYLDSTATSEWLLDGNTNGALKYIGTNDAFDFPIYANGVEVMRITTTGRVGIGTTTPSDTLEVVGNAIINGKLTVTGVIDPTALILSGSTDLYFESSTGTTAAVSGAATGRIRYNNTTGTWQVSMQTSPYADLLTSDTGWMLNGNTVGAIKYIGTNDAFDFPVYTNGAEVARFYTTGLFGLGSQAGPNQGSLSIGYGATNLSTTDINNTVVGVFAAPSLTGKRNSIFGTNAMAAATTAERNSAFGDSALGSNSTGFGHTAVGWAALSSIAGGVYSTAIGFSALAADISGGNTAVGASAGAAATGTDLALFGYQAWEFGTTGVSNSVFGSGAFRRNVTGSRNTVLGTAAGHFSVAASSDNVYIGYEAGYYNNDTGSFTGTVGRNQNVIIGSLAGISYTGSGSVILGYAANATSIPTDNILYIHNGDTSTPLVFGDFANTFFGINTSTPYLVDDFVTFQKNVDALINVTLANTSATTSAQAQFDVSVNGVDAQFGAFASTFSGDFAGEAYLQSGSRLHLVADNPAAGKSGIILHPKGFSTTIAEEMFGNEVTTTNATTTTALSITVPSNTVYLIEARIAARVTAVGVGTVGDGDCYIRTAAFRNVAGVVTQISPPPQTSFTAEDNATFNATFDVSGTSVRVRVTGAAATTVNWTVIARVVPRT